MKWPKQKISAFCQTGSGGTPSRKNADYYGGSISWVKSGELKNDVIIKTEEYITEKGLKESSAKLIPRNSILIAMYGATVGKTAILGVDAATNQAVCNIQPNPEIAHYGFVKHYLDHSINDLLQKRVGGAQPNVSQQIIKNIDIPLPPISEQQKIVEILDQADRLRKLRTDADKKAERILLALFLKMFGDPASNPMGWDKKPFERLVEIGTQMVNPNNEKYQNLAHIGVENIESQTGIILPYKRVVDCNLRSNKFYFSSRHILLSKIRPYLNKVAFPKFEGLCSADIYPIVPKIDEITPLYLITLLRSQAFLDYAKANSDRLRIPKLNRKQLGAFKIPIPDQNTLMIFEKQAEKIMNIEIFLRISQKKIEKIFNTLLYGAFTGDLTASWRQAHMKELLQEMEIQARALAK